MMTATKASHHRPPPPLQRQSISVLQMEKFQTFPILAVIAAAGVLVVVTCTIALFLWRKSETANVVADNELKERVAAAASNRFQPPKRKKKQTSQKKAQEQNKTLRAPATPSQQQKLNDAREHARLAAESRRGGDQQDSAVTKVDGGRREEIRIRQATIGDQVAWNEEKASQEQFGWSIYGHKPCDCCCVDSKSSATKTFASLPTGFDAIQGVSEIPGLPGSDNALILLQQLCREFEPVARARGWAVGRLVELCCCNDTKPPNVAGYCVPTGDGRTAKSIHIRLRPPGSCQRFQFNGYESLVKTMAHELAHVRISAHNDAFYKLMAELENERVEFLAKGSLVDDGGTGQQHFPLTSGRRLGTASGLSPVLGSRELRQRTAKAAAKRLAQSKHVTQTEKEHTEPK